MESTLKALSTGLILLHLLFATLTLKNVDGLWTYLLFNFTFCGVAISLIFLIQRPALFYFNLLFWIGYYLKVIVHFIFSYLYVEPIGAFTGKQEEWHQYFLLTGLAALVISLFNLILTRRGILEFKSTPTEKLLSSFSSSGKIFFTQLGLFTLFAFFVLGVNYYLAIYIVGLTPRTVLPWPLNPLINWFIYIGFAQLLCEFYKFSLDLKYRRYFIFAILLIISFSISVTTLSRGMFIYQVIPVLFVMFVYRKELQVTWFEWGTKMILTAIILVFMLSIVSGLRTLVFANWDQSTPEASQGQLQLLKRNSESKQLDLLPVSKSLELVLKLSIDRWIGAEGLMSVIAYPKKSIELFWSNHVWATNDKEENVINEISNSLYKTMDYSKPFRFSVIPGLIAFLFYSGNFLYVLVGVSLMYSVVFFLDSIINRFNTNVFSAHIISFWLANSAVQFGIQPTTVGKGLVLILICLTVSRYLTAWIAARSTIE